MKSSAIYLLMLMLGISLSVMAQTDVAVLEKQNQACLDRGEDMMGCSEHFYYQMDSLLNMYYKRLRKSCDSMEHINLQDDEMDWLAQRDAYFKKTKAGYIKGDPAGIAGGSRDAQMIMYQHNADYIKARVLVLASAKVADYSTVHYRVDPTGHYKFYTQNKRMDGSIWGFDNYVKVKKLGGNKIVLRMSIAGLGQGQGEGLILDTLIYTKNTATYHPEKWDSSCYIYFTFYKSGVQVREVKADPNNACGLGHAAYADGNYKRESGKTPTDGELLKDGY